MADEQTEFDFGAPRPLRVGRALRATPAVRRAVPLSDADKLMLACMDSLAQQIADDVAGMLDARALGHIAGCIARFVGSLDDVSIDFAQETSRYLHDAVDRIRKQ